MPKHENWKDRRIVPSDEKAFLNIVRDEPRDPPTVGVFDSPTRCYQVNEEWAGHLMGALSTMDQWKAWTGAEDDRNPSVQSVMEFLIGDDCTVFQLRQNPTNSCQLQQSTDGGDTWELAFDYSLCQGGGSIFSGSVYIDLAIQTINDYTTNYHDEGDVIINVYPNLEWGGPGDDVDRNAAICYSITALLDAIFDSALAVAEDDLNNARFFSAFVDGAANALALFDEFLLGSLVRSITSLIFGTAALENAVDALSNQVARNSVLCCIYDNLAGATVTETAWGLAGDSCGFGSGSDPELLLAVIDPLFADLSTYLSLMAILSDAVVLAAADLIENTCTSLCGAWTAYIDYETTNGGFVLDQSLLAGDNGDYVPSTGWIATRLENPGATGESNAVTISLTFAAGDHLLTEVELTYDYVKADFSDYPGALALQIARSTDVTNVAETGMSDGTGQTKSSSATPEYADKVLLFLRSFLQNIPPSTGPYGTAILKSIEISGEGSIPSELSSYII